MDETKQTLWTTTTTTLRRPSVCPSVCLSTLWLLPCLSAAHFPPAKMPKLGHFVSLWDKPTGHYGDLSFIAPLLLTSVPPPHPPLPEEMLAG